MLLELRSSARANYLRRDQNNQNQKFGTKSAFFFKKLIRVVRGSNASSRLGHQKARENIPLSITAQASHIFLEIIKTTS
jgi:hypothetical protein